MAFGKFTKASHGPTRHGKVMPGITKQGEKGKAPKGSSSKKSLDGGVPGLQLGALHKAGGTVSTWQAERLAGLEQGGPANKSRSK